MGRKKSCAFTPCLATRTCQLECRRYIGVTSWATKEQCKWDNNLNKKEDNYWEKCLEGMTEGELWLNDLADKN